MSHFQSILRHKKKLLWFFYFAVMAAVMAGGVFYFCHRPRPWLRAEVRFLGYTNSPAGVRQVCLGVKNMGPFPIANADSLTCTPVALPSQAEEIVLLTAPVTTNSWKLDLSYQYYETGPTRLFKALIRLAGLDAPTIVYPVPGPLLEP